MLDFFNLIRSLIMKKEPNEGHYIIAELEDEYEVTVITQNGDDFHERAGSTNVIHLHGEALKNASTLHPYEEGKRSTWTEMSQPRLRERQPPFYV